MSAPPFAAFKPPLLPPGWTEHQAPGGQPYYYNPQTKESTYIRPLPSFQNLPPAQSTQKTKERPILKTQIPGTEWLRVKTTEGNVFYTHKVKKQSLWSVPDEIKTAVEHLEREEKAQKEQAQRGHKVQPEEMLEVKKVKNDIRENVKRKAAEDVQLDEVVISKKAKVEDEEEEDEEESEEEEEEEWQREAAAQLAAEAEEEKKRAEEEARLEAEAAEAEARRAKDAQINMPDRVDLSIEEGKALFKNLLREKDINPLHPWDTSLPKFVSDPRYVLLPSVSARREAFDEYCRDRARELRRQAVNKDIRTPKEEYEALLNAEVKSTRTSWTEFRRAWKKDRRFYGFGKDDREREKLFRDFVRELGEKKKVAAQKAEADFFALLKESAEIEPGSVWKEVKRDLVKDPRYDAVGSSSLREELFNTFVKAKSGTSSLPAPEDGQVDEHIRSVTDKSESKKDRKERAVKEREDKVRAERERVDTMNSKSRMELNKEEGEREFKTLLTDAIRDPQVSWESVLPQLQTDPRFNHSPLPMNQQLHLFHEHVSNLRSKHLNNLHSLFESHAPSLATTFEDLSVSSLLASAPATRLSLSEGELKQDFEKWQRERTYASRQAFDEMLHENSFVEFWGRLGKIGGEGVDGGVKADETGEDEGEFNGGKVDMKSLAKNVDVEDMEKVLRNDKRYIMFNHIPEQREQWIRDYLSQLSAPKLSVHIPSSS